MILSNLEKLPIDPVLNLIATCSEDQNINKIDLTIGVFLDDSGKAPILPSVKSAEKQLLDDEKTKGYIPWIGVLDYVDAIRDLIFSPNHMIIQEDRVRTIQTPGGSCALRIASDYIKYCNPNSIMWLPDPSWANHIPIVRSSRLEIHEFPYYDNDSKEIVFDKMISALKKIRKNDIVLLHGCCHNPTGADLTNDQWQIVAKQIAKCGAIPLIDLAYQGFRDGLDEDAYAVRLLANKVPEMFVANSCSKNFGLYQERVGALSIIVSNKCHAYNMLAHLGKIVGPNYFVPPNHGAAIVSLILNNPKLHQLWKSELSNMRDHITMMRRMLAQALAEKSVRNFSHIATQHGMFSKLGITTSEVHRLRDEFHIYLTDQGRLNFAALSQINIERISSAIAII